jgi:hypothetical protein
MAELQYRVDHGRKMHDGDHADLVRMTPKFPKGDMDRSARYRCSSRVTIAYARVPPVRQGERHRDQSLGFVDPSATKAQARPTELQSYQQCFLQCGTT